MDKFFLERVRFSDFILQNVRRIFAFLQYSACLVETAELRIISLGLYLRFCEVSEVSYSSLKKHFTNLVVGLVCFFLVVNLLRKSIQCKYAFL